MFSRDWHVLLAITNADDAKMADPKYANLPGIDLGSPDVYETSELPEEDQNDKNVGDLTSESVDILSVDTKQAYDRFRGKTVDAEGIDFSDKISQSRRTGYIAQTEYELLEEGSAIKETPQQKYQRLQHEIRDLSEEVGKIKENVKDSASTEKLSPVNLSKQLEYINHQLSDLHLEKLLGPEGSVDISDPQGALKKRLLTQLVAYKPLDSPAGKGKQKTGAGDYVTYQLHYKPEQAQFSKNARMANLDERLERLEAVIGTNVEKMGLLTADTSNKSLVGSVAMLNSKLSLLEPSQLDQVEGRLQSVMHKLNQISEKQPEQQAEQQEEQKKISELYDAVKKWDSFADTLPHVAERLSALKDLHEQALQFSQALTYLDTTQQAITSTLAEHGDMLKQLQESYKKTTGAIKANCESLDARMKALSKS